MGQVVYPKQFANSKHIKKTRRHMPIKSAPISKLANKRVKFSAGQIVLVRYERHYREKVVMGFKLDGEKLRYQLNDLNWYFAAQLMTPKEYEDDS